MEPEYDDLYEEDCFEEYLLYRRQLPELFNIELDLFPKANSMHVTGKRIKLYDLFQKIKYNLAQDSKNDFEKDYDTDILLTDKYKNGKKNSEYDSKKVKYPLVAYNATFNSYKKNDDVKTITNLMYLDIDCFKTKEETLEYKEEIIIKYDWIVGCYRSLSKIGLHIIIQADKIHSNDDFNAKYDHISRVYFHNKLDKSAKSLSRFTIIPFDPDIYINDNPDVLAIDKEFAESKKSTRSAYKDNTDGTSEEESTRSSCLNGNNFNHFDKKSTRSAYKREKKEVCTPYTFSPYSLDEIMNNAARENNLIYRTELDEAAFENPNESVFDREGVPVIKINLFPYKHKPAIQGKRNNFLGAVCIQMLFLNRDSKNEIDEEKSQSVLNFILGINKKCCRPSLDESEAIKIFKGNYKRFKEGKADIAKYLKTQKAFWSKLSTLTANEKRSDTMKKIHEPLMKESKMKIREGIKALQETGEKVTQQKVADMVDMSVSTVKKYRVYYNELLGRKKPSKDKVAGSIVTESIDIAVDIDDTLNCEDQNDPIDDAMDTIGSSHSDNELNISKSGIRNEISTSSAQTQEVYNRVYKTILPKLDEEQKQKLLVGFIQKVKVLTDEDIETLCADPNTIENSDIYFRQMSIESSLLSLAEDYLIRA